jgi:hypothetical protein
MHLKDETLRAFLDGELEPAGAAEAEAHLAQCDSCREQLERIRARALHVASSLTTAEGQEKESPKAAFARLRPRLVEAPSGRSSAWKQRLRMAWAPAVLVIALAGALSVPAVRAWAAEFLGLFRVQHVTVLPVDITRLSALSKDQPLTTQLSELLSSSVTKAREAGEPQAASDAEQASRLAGFEVRLPTDREDAPELLVQSGEAYDIRVDRERAQSLLEAAGFGNLVLPQSIDGATISIDIPTGVTAGYGDCPVLKEALSEGPDAMGSPARQYANCILLAEMPSPTVSTPPDLDIEQLAELGLQLTGMTAEQAHQYGQTVDWTSTLVIPIPRNGASYKKVAVDGVTGYLIQRPTDDAPQFALVWVKNGIIYAIGGLGNNAQEALDMAEAMP